MISNGITQLVATWHT